MLEKSAIIPTMIILDEEDVCLAKGGKEVYLLILVLSASSSVVERVTTRRTWGSTKELDRSCVVTKYFLGRPNRNALPPNQMYVLC